MCIYGLVSPVNLSANMFRLLERDLSCETLLYGPSGL